MYDKVSHQLQTRNGPSDQRKPRELQMRLQKWLSSRVLRRSLLFHSPIALGFWLHQLPHNPTWAKSLCLLPVAFFCWHLILGHLQLLDLYLQILCVHIFGFIYSEAFTPNLIFPPEKLGQWCGMNYQESVSHLEKITMVESVWYSSFETLESVEGFQLPGEGMDSNLWLILVPFLS